MRKLTIALLAGLTAFGVAAPAAAQNPRGDRDRDGVPNRYDRNDNRPQAQWRDNDRDGIPNRYDRNDRRPNRGGYGDRDRDGIPNRYDRNDFSYRQGWNHNDRWTPYGWGYNDRATQAWVQRTYGGLNDRNWRRAQTDFYRYADRNRDGRISRTEYDWAQRNIYGFRR